ncbi:hypothetical protein C8J98_104154 [Luteibacter sp. OK325]|uniref:hypothetical protein n=1 Tax=Luteibacter sp. OK325 TaxID=2135670 RepID=UPI000D4DC2BD|nr:hypothetical protein [Luteibacter sp. OK325]PTR32943.1 hypothetical protein C8J98_104154 [Luteibacter sp. OK325]
MNIISGKFPLRWIAALCWLMIVGCSNDEPPVQDCVHDDREVPASGASDYVLHTEETICDNFAHSDTVLLYLVKRGEARRIEVFEYVPAMTRDEPRVTWVSPGRLRIDFRAVESVVKTYQVNELQVNIYVATPPPRP